MISSLLRAMAEKGKKKIENPTCKMLQELCRRFKRKNNPRSESFLFAAKGKGDL